MAAQRAETWEHVPRHISITGMHISITGRHISITGRHVPRKKDADNIIAKLIDELFVVPLLVDKSLSKQLALSNSLWATISIVI